MSGLGHTYWHHVIGVLRTIIPVYDKVNRAISLGKDDKFRLAGISGRISAGDLVLDAGSGYGNMTRIAQLATTDKLRVVMYDPIHEMLYNAINARARLTENFTCGIFEYLPFQSGTFDAVMCGYSLRDSINLGGAISEIHRVLKDGGRLVIVDLGKPDNFFKRAGVTFYLKYVLSIVAFLFAGKKGLKFKTLYGTYLRWPKNSELNALLNSNFTKVDFQQPLLGGAIIVAAYK